MTQLIVLEKFILFSAMFCYIDTEQNHVLSRGFLVRDVGFIYMFLTLKKVLVFSR